MTEIKDEAPVDGELDAGGRELTGDPVSFLVVYDDSDVRCVGHLFLRGPAGVEGFDRDDRSLGFFDDLELAAAAVRGAARCA
jgi:hypothetical protein